MKQIVAAFITSVQHCIGIQANAARQKKKSQQRNGKGRLRTVDHLSLSAD